MLEVVQTHLTKYNSDRFTNAGELIKINKKTPLIEPPLCTRKLSDVSSIRRTPFEKH